MSTEKAKKTSYFYTKKYFNPQNHEVFVKKYSRSFERGNEAPKKRTDGLKSNVTESSLSRAKSAIRLLSFYNPQLTGFLTLTNADCPSELEANRRFKLFVKKVRFHYGSSFQFIGVKEYQKRGSIHWHLMCNFCPGQILRPLWDNPYQQQCSLWDYGISDYQPYDPLRNVDGNFSTQLYLFKYLTKNNQKLFTTHYVRSRNLNKPLQPQYLSHNYFSSPRNAKNVFLKTVNVIVSGKPLVAMHVLEYNYSILSKSE